MKVSENWFALAKYHVHPMAKDVILGFGSLATILLWMCTKQVARLLLITLRCRGNSSGHVAGGMFGTCVGDRDGEKRKGPIRILMSTAGWCGIWLQVSKTSC
jgi:hypothetical protein